MKQLKDKLAAIGRAIGTWYNRHIRVEPGVLVWPEPSRPRVARARARAPRRS